MSFMQIVQMVRLILSIGTPPDIADEAALKDWVGKLVGKLKNIAEQTDIEIDDKAVAILDAIVTSEIGWDIGYGLLKMLFIKKDDLPMGDSSEMLLAEKIASAISDEDKPQFINPMTILAIFMTVVDLIKMWQFGRQNQ